MDAIVAAIALGDLRHLDNFVRILRSLGVPRGGEPERTLFHRLSDEPVHLFLFGGIGRPLIESAHHPLHLLRRDAGSDVDRYAAVHHRVEVAGKCRPIGFDAVALAMLEPIFFQHRALERRHGLAFTDDIQGHALAHFALGVAIGDQRLIAVRVHVDIAGRNHSSFGRNRPLAGRD